VEEVMSPPLMVNLLLVKKVDCVLMKKNYPFDDFVRFGAV
jgi:hypothetical protein